MKRIKIVIIAISIILIAVGVKTTTAQEDVQQVLDVACLAKDVPSYKDCIQKVQNGETDFVKITDMIECRSQDDCAIRLSDITRTVVIYGVSNTGTGFRRVDNFDYALFTLQNAAKVSIGGFLIDDGDTTFCPLGTACPPLILIQNSDKMLVEALISKSAKNTVVFVSGSKHTTIRKSVFDNSQNHAIEVQNASSDTTIDNNTFRNTWSNALVFSSLGKNVIQNNIFAHNHMIPLYTNCGGFCIGSQLHILEGTDDILISKNKIMDGSIDSYTPLGLYASGIEIDPSNVKKATISCNTILNNTGNGIVISNRTASTEQVIMKNNTIIDSGLNTNFLLNATDEIQGNCFSSSCRVEGC